jgi:ABC-2 type transport system permease protein
MIWTVMQTSWRRLKNNRSELFLTFIVPIVFFSIFAVIFGSRDSASSTPKIKIAISDTSGAALSERAVKLLEEQKSLRVSENSRSHGASKEGASGASTVSRSAAEDLVRRGMVSAAIVFEKSELADSANGLPKIEIMTDSFDQVASQVLAAIVQKAVMTANGELLKEKSDKFVQANAPIPANASMVKSSLPMNLVRTADFNANADASGASSSSLSQPPTIDVVDVIGGKKTNPVVAMYAAGIAVMFLLFSATTASGSLLEERENSTLDRLLCSRLTMDQLLLGKWAYLTVIGSIQMALMFTWGAIVFGIDLLHHLDGFVALTLVTAGAAASFALMLAALCTSRMQLGWVSTIVILSMSALGGSMVPRYLMSETIQKAGLLTFNAWALEGYNKLFWRELPLADLKLELAVLLGCGFLFIVAARLFAVRWERS